MKNSRLKVVLFEKGITQTELAKATGVPRAYISMAVNGWFNLSDADQGKIAKQLGIPKERIF